MGGARFDFHGISGERGIVAKESDGDGAGRARREGVEPGREDGRRVTQGIYRANFTIPDTMVPRRHWPCLTAVSSLPVVTSSGYLHLHREHIVLGGNSRGASLSALPPSAAAAAARRTRR